mmetsp:Transcript_37896/g.94005  ORF Transcript_37896/g.94005 Transcript_37896/m.94005 type:complete len:204 (-) Transcript_37896:81-692(-)
MLRGHGGAACVLGKVLRPLAVRRNAAADGCDGDARAHRAGVSGHRAGRNPMAIAPSSCSLHSLWPNGATHRLSHHPNSYRPFLAARRCACACASRGGLKRWPGTCTPARRMDACCTLRSLIAGRGADVRWAHWCRVLSPLPLPLSSICAGPSSAAPRHCLVGRHSHSRRSCSTRMRPARVCIRVRKVLCVSSTCSCGVFLRFS